MPLKPDKKISEIEHTVASLQKEIGEMKLTAERQMGVLDMIEEAVAKQMEKEATRTSIHLSSPQATSKPARGSRKTIAHEPLERPEIS
ncbi:unnamed protein product [Arabis nemorensis]|uniref:Uncharacterized protein n=1 Tax=Arabis nemorensis TaxID=586526 RepID=A0A565BE45_9BRAS|nr:unnamed protein product [Arabis nemorensis]